MQLTVFGASGRIGQLVVLLALERGHTVKAFVHSKNPFLDDKNLTIITGAVSDSATVGKALQGGKAVISALGSWGIKDLWGDYELLFGASKLHLEIVEVPVHYQERIFGVTKMTRVFANGARMFRICWHAWKRLGG